MAEDSPKPDRGGLHRLAQNKISDKVEIHRVNNILIGHVGQVSYHSVRDEDADIGQLRLSRVVENRKLTSLGHKGYILSFTQA
jgi:hypothetical protein